jgi:hypothetical protein
VLSVTIRRCLMMWTMGTDPKTKVVAFLATSDFKSIRMHSYWLGELTRYLQNFHPCGGLCNAIVISGISVQPCHLIASDMAPSKVMRCNCLQASIVPSQKLWATLVRWAAFRPLAVENGLKAALRTHGY